MGVFPEFIVDNPASREWRAKLGAPARIMGRKLGKDIIVEGQAVHPTFPPLVLCRFLSKILWNLPCRDIHVLDLSQEALIMP